VVRALTAALVAPRRYGTSEAIAVPGGYLQKSVVLWILCAKYAFSGSCLSDQSQNDQCVWWVSVRFSYPSMSHLDELPTAHFRMGSGQYLQRCDLPPPLLRSSELRCCPP
jgi:hypothetical protein